MGGKDSQEGALAKTAGKIQPPTLISACKISPKLLHFPEAQLRHKLPLSPAPAEGRKQFGFGLKGEVDIVIWVGGSRAKKQGGERGGKMALLTLLFLEIIMPTPKPELWAETNFPLAPWKNLTLWCRSPSGSTKEFVLLKDGTGWIATRPASEQVRAAFPLGALTQSHTGSYHCHSWEEMAVSEPSEALELVGTGKKRQRFLPG